MPGQHINEHGIRHVIPEIDPHSQTDKREALNIWVAQQQYNVVHDSGSPISFHSAAFRQKLPPSEITYMGKTLIRVRGFFDSKEGPPAKPREVKIYTILAGLAPNGRKYPIISHEMPPHSTTCDTLLIGRGSMAQNEWDWIHRNGTTYISAHGVKVPTIPKQTQKASSVIKSISTDGKEEVHQAPIETYTTEMIQEVQHLIPDQTQTHLHNQALLHEKIGTWKQYDHLIQDYEQRFKKVVRDMHPTLDDCILL